MTDLSPAPPSPPPGARNLVVVVLDSLRYDSWLEAGPKNLADARRGRAALELRELDRALALQPADGPAAAHSPPEVYASEYYKEDFLRYSERLGIEGIEFQRMLPSILLPTYLRTRWATRPTRWSRCRCSTRTR